LRPALHAHLHSLAKVALAFAPDEIWYIFIRMQSQNSGGRNEARTLRAHLSQLLADKQREIDHKLGRSSPSISSREELIAEVSQEAADLDYERWDGLS
jgi:23S rRNA maturation mini-RNase III